MKKNLTVSLLGLAVLLLILVGVFFIFPVGRRDEKKKTPIPKAERLEKVLTKVTLNFSPQELSLSAGESLTVNLLVKSEKKIVATDLFFSYDSQTLDLKEIKPGGFFSQPKELSQAINRASGKASYALGSFTPTAGEDILLTLTFKAKKGGKQAWVLLEKDTRVAIEKGEKVNLELPPPGKYIILESDSQP